MMTMIITINIFINENRDDHVHPNLHLGKGMIMIIIFFINNSLYSCFDPGRDHDDYDNHDDFDNHDDYDNNDDHDNKDTLHLGYKQEDNYGDNILHSLHPCYDPGEDHDNHDNHKPYSTYSSSWL